MTQDTRKDRRVKIVSLNVRYKSATVDEFIENHALDVSRGGIYIKTNNPFSPGTLLKFEIRLASDQAVILGVGRVVWKRDGGQGSGGERPPGMGVKFIKIDDASKTLIDRLVHARADAGSAFESEPEAAGVPGGTGATLPSAVATRFGPGGGPPPVVPRHGTMLGIGMSGRPPAADAGSRPPPATTAPTRPPVAVTSRPPTGTIVSSALPPSPTTRPPAPSPSTDSEPAGLPAPVVTTPTGTLAVPGRPSANPGMFAAPRSVMPAPRSLTPAPRSVAPPSPRQEQTVMRQAAELLEEALREAGGSMEELGTNPLFYGTAAVSDAPPGGPRPPGPGGSAGKSGALEAPPGDEVEAEPVDPAAHARAMVAAMSPAPHHPAASRDVGGMAVRDPFAEGEESGPPREGSPPSAVPVDGIDAIPGARKRGAVAGWLLFAAVVALVIVGVGYRDRFFGTRAAPAPSPSASADLPPASASSEDGSSLAPGAEAIVSDGGGPEASSGAVAGDASAVETSAASAAPLGATGSSAASASRVRPSGDAIPRAAVAPSPSGAPASVGASSAYAVDPGASAPGAPAERRSVMSDAGGAAPRSSSRSSDENPY